MTIEVYTSNINKEGFYCISGPGNGFGYYSHTLNPELSCNTEEEAKRAAKIANIAHSEGYLQAQQDMQKAMGINNG